MMIAARILLAGAATVAALGGAAAVSAQVPSATATPQSILPSPAPTAVPSATVTAPTPVAPAPQDEPVLTWSLGDAQALLGVIRNIDGEGLIPADYQMSALLISMPWLSTCRCTSPENSTCRRRGMTMPWPVSSR